MTFMIALMPSIICVAVAAYMAIRNIEGWGWFLFAALLLAGAIGQVWK